MLFDKHGKIVIGLLMSGMIGTSLVANAQETAASTPQNASAEAASVEPASAEKVSRLLVEGRKAFQSGDLAVAERNFKEVLGVDSGNAEAQKYLQSIADRNSGSELKPDAGSEGSKPAKTEAARTASTGAVADVAKTVTAGGTASDIPAAEDATTVAIASSEPVSTTSAQADPAVAADLKSAEKKTSDNKAQNDVQKAMGALNTPVTSLDPIKDAKETTGSPVASAPSTGAEKKSVAPVAKAPASDVSDTVEVKPQAPKTVDSPACTADAAFEKGLAAYQAGTLDVAVQWWNYALSMQPNHAQSRDYLQRTRSEYEAWVQQHQAGAIDTQREGAAIDKMASPVSYDSDGPKTIVEFLSALSLSTDVSFYVTDGVDPDMKLAAKLDNVALNDALDTVLLPVGLKWTRSADVITVAPDLSTKFFTLAPEQISQMKTILESKTLQKMLYGKDGTPPMRNVEIALDDRSNMLMVTDSSENLQKVEAFLQDMKVVAPQGLIYKSWKIRPEEGNKIKALVEALIRTNSDAPYDMERRVVVDGEDLIVKDTADNVAKVEELLADKNFIKKINDQKLEVATFNLTPREPLPDNPEQVRELAQNVVTVVKTILYSQSTESAAASEGRRFWYDPNTLQLTVTDYPDNLKVVSDFVRGLPLFGKKAKSEIIFLRHQTSSELSSLLERVLGISSGDSSGKSGSSNSNTITKTLRRKSEMTFRDLVVRCIRVEQGGDANDDTQDSVELTVRTNTNSQDVTLQEYRSQFIDDYEIYAGDIKPSGDTGDGSARITITYRPGAGYGNDNFSNTTGGNQGNDAIMGQNGQNGQNGTSTGTSFADIGLQIETIDNMNALLIRYEDPGDLAEVKSWIEQLDIPVMQVSIETKLVEVNEQKAKEFLPELKLNNLGQGISLSDNRLDSGFGSATDNFQLPFGPFANTPNNNSLMTAYSTLNFTSFGESPVSFNLRALEAEGVLTLTNGPHVTVENGETADFEIEKFFGSLPTYNSNSSNNSNSSSNNNSSNGNYNSSSFRQVSMSVSPQITQIGEIRLEISDLELQDLGNDNGGQVTLGSAGTIGTGGTTTGDTNTGTNNGTNNSNTSGNGNTLSNLFGPTAITTNFNQDRRRRSLTTVARVRDGGTIVLGGWNGERTVNQESGVPGLRNLPYLGKLFFNKTNDRVDKTTLLIFLTCNIVKP